MTHPVIFMYSGQGSQYHHMGRELFDRDPVFRRALEECEAAYRVVTGRSLLDEIFAPGRSRREPFDDTRKTHPAIVAVEYALSQVVLGWGVRPRYLLGYSVGEVAAAVVAGVIDFADGLTLATRQAALLHERCPAGGMLAILGPPALAAERPQLFAGTDVAAVNLERHFVVAGAPEDLKRIREELLVEEVPAQVLPVTQAFHSRFMEPAREELLALGTGLVPRPPATPLVSATFGGEVSGWSADFLWQLARRPVQFHGTVRALEEQGPFVYLDLGPSATLANFVDYALAEGSGSTTLASLRRSGRDVESMAALQVALELRLGSAAVAQPASSWTVPDPT
jgi:trans-AT polyketide synthase/acyltransferase/oxidoreductase domain-containing protein